MEPFPGLRYLFIFHGDETIREAALGKIVSGLPSPFLFAAIAWRLNDRALPVRRAAAECARNWVGIYRTFDVNIGNTPHVRIAVKVRSALDDAEYWHVNQTYEPHELAIRLHHHLVLIHPFVSGNGRCTRMMADIVVKRLKAEPLTWGAGSLAETGAARAAYIEALGAADNHDIKALLVFARS